MAQLIGVKLSRFDGSPWGFRLQGGKDFGTALIVQKVSGFFCIEFVGCDEEVGWDRFGKGMFLAE